MTNLLSAYRAKLKAGADYSIGGLANRASAFRILCWTALFFIGILHHAQSNFRDTELWPFFRIVDGQYKDPLRFRDPDAGPSVAIIGSSEIHNYMVHYDSLGLALYREALHNHGMKLDVLQRTQRGISYDQKRSSVREAGGLGASIIVVSFPFFQTLVYNERPNEFQPFQKEDSAWSAYNSPKKIVLGILKPQSTVHDLLSERFPDYRVNLYRTIHKPTVKEPALNSQLRAANSADTAPNLQAERDAFSSFEIPPEFSFDYDVFDRIQRLPSAKELRIMFEAVAEPAKGTDATVVIFISPACHAKLEARKVAILNDLSAAIDEAGAQLESSHIVVINALTNVTIDPSDCRDVVHAFRFEPAAKFLFEELKNHGLLPGHAQ